MRADIGTILGSPTGRAHILALLEECAAVGEAGGRAPSPDALDAYRDQLTDPESTSTSSMLRDMRAGSPTEGRHILGDLCDRAAASGLETPLLKLCRDHVLAYESLRAASRPK